MTKPIQLHLGCGKRNIPGFIHIDQADFPHLHHRASIAQLPMFAEETVDLIYCSHAFEYFDRQEARGVLGEWRRVLRRGGLLRLAVPDFEALLALYQQTGNLEYLLGPLYGRMETGAPNPGLIYHKTVYDFRSLRALLEAAGFDNVRRYDWRETIHRDHDDHSQSYFPHLDKEHGLLLSLNVAADKG